MEAQVSIRDGGYVVEARFTEAETYIYKPLKNFGDRQSDAIEFRNDLQKCKYSDNRVKSMAKNYDKNSLYRRIDECNIAKEKIRRKVTQLELF